MIGIARPWKPEYEPSATVFVFSVVFVFGSLYYKGTTPISLQNIGNCADKQYGHVWNHNVYH